VVADFTAGDEHGGFGRIVHGGLTAALVDEAFGWAVWTLVGRAAVTVELRVAYRAPIYCGVPVTVRSWIAEQDARTARVCAEIRAASDGALAASADGTMRLASRRAIERMGGFATGD
jgi:acyl-coenzyme A thioesterase PaaI-like protein